MSNLSKARQQRFQTASGDIMSEVATRIVRAMEHYLGGRRIAAQVQRERAHYQRLADSLACPDCISMCGESTCLAHNVNAEDL